MNTLQCLHENQVQNNVSHEKHNTKCLHENEVQKLIYVSMEMKDRTLYHMKSITEINTL